jgi:hypothetical protein
VTCDEQKELDRNDILVVDKIYLIQNNDDEKVMEKPDLNALQIPVLMKISDVENAQMNMNLTYNMIHNEKQARDPMKMKLELIYSLLFFLFDCFFKQISKKNHKKTKLKKMSGCWSCC